ncbi:MAG: hypothetical protein K5663_05485 [Clostridiales bacterium]|nr:hypothetical protein [Clostridiales bacterium]
MDSATIFIVVIVVIVLVIATFALARGYDKKHPKKEASNQADIEPITACTEENGMWANIGSKCKTLASALCALGIIGCIICGIILTARGSKIRDGESLIIAGLAVAFVGSFASYLGSIGLYAIGEAAEKSAYAAKYIEKLEAEKKEKENKTE